MKVCSTACLAILWYFGLTAALGAQFDASQSETKPERPYTRDDPFGTKAEEKAWRAWVESLGRERVYQVEILWRWTEDNRLYYLRTLVSPKEPRGGVLMGLGLDQKGKPVPPPDPGYQRIVSVRQVVSSKNEMPPPPLALSTRYVGARLSDKTATPTFLQIHSSDVGTGVPLPPKPGDVRIAFFGTAAFRIEWLTPAQLDSLQPVRQDPVFYRKRTAELHHELITTHKALLLEQRNLELALRVLQEPFLIEAVRQRLTAWIEQPPDKEKDALKIWRLPDALADFGTDEDFALLQKLADCDPERFQSLLWPALRLAKRSGAAKGLPLLTKLFEDPRCERPRDVFVKLRQLEPALADLTFGDLAVIEFTRTFQLDPLDFHLRLAESRLLEHSGKHPLSKDLLQQVHLALRNPTYGHWMYYTAEARRQGLAKALAWLRSYRVPK